MLEPDHESPSVIGRDGFASPPCPSRNAVILPLVSGILCSVLLIATACGREPGIRIEGRELTVACGACIFEMEGVEGCPWAAEVDGEHFLMKGDFGHDHNSHMPDGICNMPRKARVWGELRGDALYVARFELLDAEGIPESPRFTPADIH